MRRTVVATVATIIAVDFGMEIIFLFIIIIFGAFAVERNVLYAFDCVKLLIKMRQSLCSALKFTSSQRLNYANEENRVRYEMLSPCRMYTRYRHTSPSRSRSLMCFLTFLRHTESKTAIFFLCLSRHSENRKLRETHKLRYSLYFTASAALPFSHFVHENISYICHRHLQMNV